MVGYTWCFIFSDPGGIRRRPFSCSRSHLDNQKKQNRWSVKKITKNQEKKRKNGPHRSQAQSWAWRAGVSNKYQESINRVSHWNQESVAW
jgi:hypothetical protein